MAFLNNKPGKTPIVRQEYLKMAYSPVIQKILVSLLFLSLGGCAAATDTYRDQHMDFGSVQTIAVLPFVNLSHEGVAAERVKDVFTNMLLASGSIYVLPPGEVNRGVNIVGIASPSNPSKDEIIRFASAVKADAVITGVVREYGELRSGT